MEFTQSPLEPFGEELLSVDLPSNLAYKSPLVFRLVQVLREKGYVYPKTAQLAELCFDEALTNAMLHGNKQDVSKNVHIRLFGDKEKWGLILMDEGDGFTADRVPNWKSIELDDMLEEKGRGILLIDGYVDDLKFNAKGNALRMVRHKETEQEAAEAPTLEPLAVEEAIILGDVPDAADVLEEVVEMGDDDVLSLDDDDDLITAFCDVETRGGIAIMTINEKHLSDANVAILREEVTTAMMSCTSLVVDMARVEYISSVIIGAFAAIFKHVRGKGGRLVVCRVQPVVQQVFEMVKFDRMLDSAPDIAAAVKLIEANGK